MSSSDFRDTLVELIDTAPEAMDHPSPDQWIAYHRGELPPDEESRLQEHLVRCRDCFDLASAAAAFAQPDEEGQETDTAALWHLLRPQLDPPPSSPSPENVREITAGPRGRPSWRFRLPTYLAASFFVGLVGLFIWNVHLQGVNRALQAPQPNVPIVEFSPGERLPTFVGTPEKTFSASNRPVLMFHPAQELPAYWLTLSDATTGREMGPYEMHLNENLALTFRLPEGLHPGRYRLELADGSEGRKGRTIETHLVEVKEAGQGE